MRLSLSAPTLLLVCCAPAAGSSLSTDAFPTIETAPPAVLDAAPPPPVRQPGGEAEHYARTHGVSVDEARRRLQLQHVVSDEIGRIRHRLETEQAGNYADMWIEHLPHWRVVVAFVRDPEATLRRYTRHPLFAARQVAHPLNALERARDAAFAELQRLGIPGGGGVDVRENRVGIDVSLDQPELDALVDSGRLRVSPLVRLSGMASLSPAEAVAPEAARFVRIFPRARYRTHFETSELNVGTIVLRDGCLRLDRPGADDPLVLFGAESGLKLDGQGRLIVYSRGARDRRNARIGERMVLGGGAGREISDPEALAPIGAACGAGPVVWAGNPHSYAQFRMQNVGWQIDSLASRERISRESAFARIRACWALEEAAAERARLAGAPPPPSPPCELAPPPPVEG